MHWLLRELIGRATRRVTRHWYARFERRAQRCRDTQHRVLFEKLRRNRESDFGRDHHVGRILTIADFRRQIPIADYDYYRPYIDRVKSGYPQAMFGPDATLHMFAMTSGTTSEPKYLPVTDDHLQAYRSGWMLWGIRTYDSHPEIYRLKVLGLASDWRSSFTETGIPCGSISGLTAHGQKRIVRERYCVPSCLMAVHEIEAKLYAALRISIVTPVGMATAANPSTLVRLAILGDTEREMLLRDLRDGTLTTNYAYPESIRSSLASLIRQKHPQRVRELESIIARTGHLYPKDYWPQLQVLATWTGGSMRPYLRQCAPYWGTPPVRDIGLLASEARMTIPVEDNTPAGALDIMHQYYEFVPEAEVNDSHPTILEAHELEPDQSYFIVLTTSSGLYRYHIHDLVRCVGWFHETPLLEFLNKGSHFSNLAGEKLSEFQVSCAVAQSLSETDLTLRGFTLAACWAEPPYYSLLVETGDLPNTEAGSRLAESIDRHLTRQNLEYENRRSTGRLGAVTIKLIPNRSWQAYTTRKLLERGGTPEQYKPLSLSGDLDFVRQFQAIGEILPSVPRSRRAYA